MPNAPFKLAEILLPELCSGNDQLSNYMLHQESFLCSGLNWPPSVSLNYPLVLKTQGKHLNHLSLTFS